MLDIHDDMVKRYSFQTLWGEVITPYSSKSKAQRSSAFEF